MTLTDFLRERIAEDSLIVARDMVTESRRTRLMRVQLERLSVVFEFEAMLELGLGGEMVDIARRRLQLMAAGYHLHPDFDDEWQL